MEKTKRLLYVIYDSKDSPVTVSETMDINLFMDTMSEDLEVLWGQYRDDSLGDKVKVAIIATGFDQPSYIVEVPMDEDRERAIRALEDFYYPQRKKNVVVEEEQEESEDDTNDIDITEEEYIPNKGHSWWKEIIAFAKKQLEEEDD